VRPTTTKEATLRAPGPQSVTFVELFFDLVFVFAVTQVTALTAHHLDPAGVLRSLLLFWLIWWAWTQFTWTLNPADTTHHAVRLITLAATAAAFIMATSVPHAFEEDALWFAVPYVVVRVLGLGLQLQLGLEGPDANPRGARIWAGFSTVGLLLVLAGAVLDPGARIWFWVLTIVADVVAAAIAGRAQDWDLHAGHLTERHGLFVIIALGESLIVAGTAVAGEARSAPLVAVAVMAVIVACLLWWTYFGWLKDALEHHAARATRAQMGPLARDAFSLSHFPLVCGIVAFAVAIEEMVAHPAEASGGVVVGALGVGVALFVAFAAVSYWRISGRFLVSRALLVAALPVPLVLVAPLTPVVPLAVVALALLALVWLEGNGRHAAGDLHRS
jgi:low temperature requirement protein LtrA